MSGAMTVDSAFESAYERARAFTIVTRERCEVLWELARSAPLGPCAEVGVYRGGSAMLLHAAAPHRAIHLFDTFRGHPAISEFDSPRAHYAGRFSDTNSDDVIRRVVGSAPSGYVQVWPGDVASWDMTRWPQPFALVHVDVDLYGSTRAALRAFVPRLVYNGVLVCDDYSEDDCPGAKAAVDEYVSDFRGAVSCEVSRAGQAILRSIALSHAGARA